MRRTPGHLFTFAAFLTACLAYPPALPAATNDRDPNERRCRTRFDEIQDQRIPYCDIFTNEDIQATPAPSFCKSPVQRALWSFGFNFAIGGKQTLDPTAKGWKPRQDCSAFSGSMSADDDAKRCCFAGFMAGILELGTQLDTIQKIARETLKDPAEEDPGLKSCLSQFNLGLTEGALACKTPSHRDIHDPSRLTACPQTTPFIGKLYQGCFLAGLMDALNEVDCNCANALRLQEVAKAISVHGSSGTKPPTPVSPPQAPAEGAYPSSESSAGR